MVRDNRSNSSQLLTPTRIVILLALVTLALLSAFLIAFLSRPSSVTLEISAPMGEKVICHVVVDGRAEAHEDTVPVSYQFRAYEFTYAVIAADAATDLTVSATDQSGSGAVNKAAGVKGKYRSDWWGASWQNEHMTSTHITNMRRSAASQQGGEEGGETNEHQGQFRH